MNQRNVYPVLVRLNRSARARRFLPKLIFTHPGFFRVLGAEVLLHVGLGVDFLVRSRTLSTPWAVAPSFLHYLPLLAVFHLATALLIAVGLYTRFGLTRWGLRLSVTVFWAMAAALFYAAILNPLVSLSWGFTYLFVSLVSYAGAVEPTHYEDLTPKEDEDDPAIVRWQAVREGPEGEITDYVCVYVNSPAHDMFKITVPMLGGRMVRDFGHLANVGLFDQFTYCITKDSSVHFAYPSLTEPGVVYPTIAVPINDGVICTFYREVVTK